MTKTKNIMMIRTINKIKSPALLLEVGDEGLVAEGVTPPVATAGPLP